MTTPTNWRALCAELHAAFNTYAVNEKHHRLLVRTADTLAQPEPEGVTDEEIEQEAVANADTDDEYRAFKYGAFFVQERIHRPTIQPVPVSDRPWEREGWCDAKGRCWFGAPPDGAADAGWILRKPSERLSHQTASLPHHALPVPEVR